jgi:hypothetical protein
VGGYDAVVLQKKNRAELLRYSLARLSPKHGEVIDRVYFHGKSVTEVAEIVGIAEAGVRCHGGAIDGPTALSGLWRSRWSGTDCFLVLLSGPPGVSFFDQCAAALF